MCACVSVTIDHPQQTTDAALAAKDGTIAQLKRELQELRAKLAVSAPLPPTPTPFESTTLCTMMSTGS